MSKASLKPGWRTVKLGDVVNYVRDRVRREETGLEYYLGGEHFGKASIHVNGRGTIANSPIGPAFHMRFKPGQTLLVSRNPHLRKASIAEFEGICADTTYVCEAVAPVLLPELLPFLMQTDAFWEHAERNKRGSTNPYLNWSDFASFEFVLPPIEEQKRIAELLWAADDVCSQHAKCCSDLELAKSSILNALTTEGLTKDASQRRRPGLAPSHWRNLSVGEVTSICQYGLSIPLNESGQYPILRMMNFRDGYVVANDLKYVDLSDSDFESFRVKKGDILFNRTNSAELVGKVGIFDLDGDYVFASYLVRLRADMSLVLPEYLNFFLNSLVGQRRLLVYATPGVNQSNISAGNLKKVVVPVPTLEEQREIVQILEAIERNESGLRQQMTRSETILRRLVNGQISDEKYSEAIHVQ